MVPLAEKAFGRELDDYLAWYNAERPHTRLGAAPRTRSISIGSRHAASRGTSRASTASAITLRRRASSIRGTPGARLELSVAYFRGRKHLPIVTIRRVA
jgi:hypothetical protein